MQPLTSSKTGFWRGTNASKTLVSFAHQAHGCFGRVDPFPGCRSHLQTFEYKAMRLSLNAGGDQGGTSDFRQRVSTSFSFIYVQLCLSLHFISLGHAPSWVAGENCKYMETLPFYASTYWGSHRPTRVASFGLCSYVFGGNSRIHKKILPTPGANQK